MQFTTLEAPSLKDLFVNTIQNSILTGELKIGEKLPSEREFAKEMQVSRAVINSGLNELMDRGFVEIHPRRGAFVADYINNGNLETLNAMMDFMELHFTDDSIRTLLEYRKLTDHLAAERIIRSATDEEIAELGTLLLPLRNAETTEEAVDAAFHYYHEFCRLSKDMILPFILMSFQQPVCNLWTRYCRQYGREALVQMLSTMYTYLEKRDLEGAKAFANEDLDRSIYGDRPVYQQDE